MKKVLIAFVALTLCSSAVFAQSQVDAYKYAKTDLNGTARYLGMGGAFGALGGDISAMNSNPAGLAVYRSSEVVTTMSLSTTKTKTDWLGNSEKADKTRFNFDNIAYVGYFPTGNDEGIIGWNVGFAYNRVKSFNRNYSMYTQGLDWSVSDYVAARAAGNEVKGLSNDSYNYNSDWLSVLAYNADFIKPVPQSQNLYYSNFGEGVNDLYNVYSSELRVNERGAIDQYDFAFGMNISDIVLVGATATITDIDYRLNTEYTELFEYDQNDLYLDNTLQTEGTGYSLNLGVIVRPTDYLRLGVAYNSPTWYKMTDYYDAYAFSSIKRSTMNEAETKEAYPPEYAYTEYEYRAPDKWLFSAAAIIGRIALVSVDYELKNYGNMKMYDRNGYSNTWTNSDIETNFTSQNTIRVGAEVKVIPQFAVRAGFAWSDSPMKSTLKDVNAEVATVGMIPSYTIDGGDIMNYTIGFGYRFTPNFYMDMACVLTNYKENAFAFSNITDGSTFVEAQPATLKTSSTRVALTLGYKF